MFFSIKLILCLGRFFPLMPLEKRVYFPHTVLHSSCLNLLALSHASCLLIQWSFTGMAFCRHPLHVTGWYGPIFYPYKFNPVFFFKPHLQLYSVISFACYIFFKYGKMVPIIFGPSSSVILTHMAAEDAALKLGQQLFLLLNEISWMVFSSFCLYITSSLTQVYSDMS